MTFLDVEAHEETELSVMRRLDRVETLLATELEIPRRQVRKRMLQLVRAREIDETNNVMEWMAAYSAAIECAERNATDPPPPSLMDRDPQGPQDAASALFGVLVKRFHGAAHALHTLRGRLSRPRRTCPCTSR
jgi:hypothetical protein